MRAKSLNRPNADIAGLARLWPIDRVHRTVEPNHREAHDVTIMS
ncbi:hypothetical protein [Kibdelosporangium philippinense]